MKVRLISYIICLFIISACASLATKSAEEVVRARVTARWQALIDNNWSDAYLYETKGYKQSHTEAQFKSRFGQSVAWKKIIVSHVSIDESGQRARVDLMLSFDVFIPGQGLEHSQTSLSETWLFDDGGWWHYVE